MVNSDWIQGIPYWTRQFSGWLVELLVGEAELEESGPCDFTMTAIDGTRYYGTFCTPDDLADCIGNLSNSGESFLVLNSWILVKELSSERLVKILNEMIEMEIIADSLEMLDPL